MRAVIPVILIVKNVTQFNQIFQKNQENHDVFWIFKKFDSSYFNVFFVFPMRTRGSNGTIASRQHDRATTTTTTRDHMREYDVKDAHVRQEEQSQPVLTNGVWRPSSFAHPILSDVDDLELLLNGPAILMMTQLLRMSKKQLRMQRFRITNRWQSRQRCPIILRWRRRLQLIHRLLFSLIQSVCYK